MHIFNLIRFLLLLSILKFHLELLQQNNNKLKIYKILKKKPSYISIIIFIIIIKLK